MNYGLPSPYITSLAVIGSNLFAGTVVGVFLSTNGGASWQKVDSGLTQTYVCPLAVSGTSIFAGTAFGGGVFRSTNNGTSWTDVNDSVTSNKSISCLAAKDSVVFAGTFDKGIFRSTNNGTSWTAVSTGLPTIGVLAISFNGTNVFAGTYDGLFLSTDNGATWHLTGLSNGQINAFATIGPVTFTAMTGGVYLSGNGTGWAPVITGLTATFDYALCIHGGYLFVGTGKGGVWRRPLSQMIGSVNPSSDEIPAIFSLQQNYPNPFNPGTTISYALPNRAHVTVKIFDVLGREISTLVDGIKPAGIHTTTWFPADLPGGFYFYRITSGRYAETKKMLLLR